MSFIAKNPLILPEVENSPTVPQMGTRGIFVSKDGWHDIDSNGRESKFATAQELLGALDGFASKEEINDSYKYYGELAIIPSNADLFTFTINDDSMTASIGAKSTDMPENVVIPHKYVVGEKIYSVTSLAENAFKNCTTIKRITIPNTVTNIGRWAFQYCSSLNGIDIPTSIVSIGMASTSSCNNLAHLYYKGTEAQWNDINKSELNNALYTATKHYEYTPTTKGYVDAEIAKIGTGGGGGGGASVTVDSELSTTSENPVQNKVITKKVNEIQTDLDDFAEKVFASFSEYNIPDYGEIVTPTDASLFNFDSSTGAITGYKGSKADIVIPYEINGVKVTKIKDSAFAGNSVITSVIIPNSVTNMGYTVFSNCTKLKKVVLPKGITDIKGNLLSGCSELTSVYIPDSVTSIWDNAFSGCTKLVSIELPEGLMSIDNGAFKNTGLKKAKIPMTEGRIGSSAFSGTPADLVVHCSQGSPVETYCKTNNIKYVLDNIDGNVYANLLETIEALLAKSVVKMVSIALPASAWIEDGANQFHQVVEIDGITPYSKVDLQPTTEQLVIFHQKDIAFVAENDDGIITIYCIGQKPTLDYDMQATVTEIA